MNLAGWLIACVVLHWRIAATNDIRWSYSYHYINILGIAIATCYLYCLFCSLCSLPVAAMIGVVTIVVLRLLQG